MKKNILNAMILGILFNSSIICAEQQFEEELRDGFTIVTQQQQNDDFVFAEISTKDNTQEIVGYKLPVDQLSTEIHHSHAPASSQIWWTRSKNAIKTISELTLPYGKGFATKVVAYQAAFPYGQIIGDGLIAGVSCAIYPFNPPAAHAFQVGATALNHTVTYLPFGEAVRGLTIAPVIEPLVKPAVKLGWWGVKSAAQGMWNFGSQLVNLVAASSPKAESQDALVASNIPAISE